MSSSHELITKAKAFNPENVTYRPPVVNSRGGKSCQLRLKGQPLVLQIPLMLTWGVNERVDEQTGRVSYDMSLQFEKGKNRSVELFCEKMKELQQKVLSDAVTNSKEWFGKRTLSKEVAEAMMYPILKYPKMKDDSGDLDYDRDPTLKLKLPYWDGRFNVELYDMDSKPLYLSQGSEKPQGDKTPMDLIPKGSHVKGLIACTGVWMTGGRFGVTWKLVQTQVRQPVRLVGTGTCHVMDDSDDDEALEQLQKHDASNETESTDAYAAGPTFSDGNDSPAAESEEEAPPAPKKKKKRVVRRKKVAASADC
tara:strand:- start:292 stop:1215 length:924 start_codon:yes stop_codon:yes gene_type:complete